MKKIIVPVDFSKFSENALETASYIAKKENSEIIVLHMLELPSSFTSQSESFAREQAIMYLKLAEKKLDSFLDKDYLKDIKLTQIIKHYKVFSELNETAQRENADLIVMGSQGTEGFKELFMGSNTEKVVRNSSIPVLVVKKVPVTSDFKTALFACDFSDGDIEPYKKAKKMLSGLGCKLQLLYVNTPYAKFKSTREKEEKAVKFLQKATGNLDDLSDVAYVSDYTVEQGIFEYANLNGMDLIVIATRGRKGLSHFFEGSITEDVANHSTLPVMTFKI